MGLVAVGIMWGNAGDLPARLPVIRSFTGDTLVVRDATLFLALRVPLLGLVQLLLLSGFLAAARDDAARGWRRLWLGASCTAALKALFETGELVLLGDAGQAGWRQCLRAGTLLSVGGFLLLAFVLWRRGELPADYLPGRRGWTRGLTWLTAVGCALYVVIVTAPL